MRNVTVEVCVGTHCTMMGAMNLMEMIEELQEEYVDINISLETKKCSKDCLGKNIAPIVFIDGEKIENATSEMIMAKIMDVVKG